MCVSALSFTKKLHVPLGQFPKPITQCLVIRFKDEFAVYPLLRPTRAVNVTCIKSKVDLLQTAHSWANAGVLYGARVGWRVAFETIKLIHAKVVLCTIFDINYHPDIAHINMQGASVLSPYTLKTDLLKCNTLRVLYSI